MTLKIWSDCLLVACLFYENQNKVRKKKQQQQKKKNKTKQNKKLLKSHKQVLFYIEHINFECIMSYILISNFKSFIDYYHNTNKLSYEFLIVQTKWSTFVVTQTKVGFAF